uniref:Uncharacterized protein n=1 Tax=Daucus carota subsp. sativus TaxID=79200 RepID=A0A164T6H8_DAUCS
MEFGYPTIIYLDPDPYITCRHVTGMMKMEMKVLAFGSPCNKDDMKKLKNKILILKWESS